MGVDPFADDLRILWIDANPACSKLELTLAVSSYGRGDRDALPAKAASGESRMNVGRAHSSEVERAYRLTGSGPLELGRECVVSNGGHVTRARGRESRCARRPSEGQC